MSFMRPEVYETDYYEVECNHGETHIVPQDIAGKVEKNRDLSDFVEGKPDHPNRKPMRKHGWLYRMQAPGYTDSTNWGACETEREAYRELLEYYGTNDDAEREDWEDDALEKAGLCKECGYKDSRKGDEFCSDICSLDYTEKQGPQDGDWQTEDYETFREVNGRGVIHTDQDNWSRDVQERMDKYQYWPNVWYVSDHGNASILNVVKATFHRETLNGVNS